jgi:pullulanase/glycogen debranching enzyme
MKLFNRGLSIICLLTMLVSCMNPAQNHSLSYGAFVRPDGVEFKIHAPNSDAVNLVIFSSFDATEGEEFPMEKNENGDWSIFQTSAGVGTYYGYRLEGVWNSSDVIIADPYSKAAVTQNSWRHVAKSLIVDDTFDWQGDTWVNLHPSDLVIYEAHVRDMTIHETSNANQQGSYLGFVEHNQRGGIEHLKSLGVNAVQFLPIWDYANVEIPFKQEASGMYNDWNPYERNHWGYMPTFYMAPESYYATDGTDIRNDWNGKDGRAVHEMKSMVKSLHNEGIAVILDVVVNHVSNYDWHPLKYIDRSVYFKLDENGNFLSQCCGNLLQTENEKVRQYIIESLKYWMLEYHIDGFRFDQCYLLSAETASLILFELRKVNPGVIIYGEAWDNREAEFSTLGWGSFNARFRDVFRGDLHKYEEKGFLFGEYRPEENLEDIQSVIMGNTTGKHSTYQSSEHAINFLEVHDDYCFNDYIKLSLGLNQKDDIITDPMAHIQLSDTVLRLNKLGALALLTSQGVPIIHQGQDWAHSQIIVPTDAPDKNVGKMDRNPYNKDNETNWVNWDEKAQNSELFEYYKGLIELRRKYTEFRHAQNNELKFQGLSDHSLGYTIRDRIAVYLNGDKNKSIDVMLPDGNWLMVANHNQVNAKGIKTLSGQINIPVTSGVVLIKQH